MEFFALIIFGLLFILSLAPRGWIGEAQTDFDLWVALDANIYKKFHSVIVPSKNGTVQIDHILVSPFGVFIIETKNIKGWIFGSEKQENWVQSLYRKKFPFQNPLKQTFRQKRVLSEYLDLNENLIYTVVYFVGKGAFKTYFPPNVIRSGLGAYIKQYQEYIISEEEISRIIEQLEDLRSDPSLTIENHIKSLHERHNSQTICPRCGSNLVKRVAKNGPNVGGDFLGCMSYPRCTYTKSIS